ncbi:MAG: phosphonate C-P lyase system protein PhnH [Pseudolabrys sp.]|nr:phosphonate C-P lyase system protein PhnH [Pseudolabrys sp.]
MTNSSNETPDSRLRGNERSLEPAFASQAAFRALMDCMARPGTFRTLEGATAPAPLTPAIAALVQSLLDYDSPFWLDPVFAGVPAVADWIRFHTGAPNVKEPHHAAFALIGDARAMPDFELFTQGSEEYPDRSTTLIVAVDDFTGAGLTLAGPGIETTGSFKATPLPDDFAARMAGNREMFPRGIDLVFAAGHAIAALPRSVRIVEER